MARLKREPVRHYTFHIYELNDWEGGIGVYVIEAEYGTRLLAIPRLQLSTTLTGSDLSDIGYMFQNSKWSRNYRDSMVQLQEMILNDL